MTTTENIPNADKTMTVVSGETSWRLVHDETRVIALLQSSGATRTQQTVFTAATREECQAEIARLNLR